MDNILHRALARWVEKDNKPALAINLQGFLMAKAKLRNQKAPP